MNKLVVWNEDWADEFDIFGFEIITEKEGKEYVEILETLIDKFGDLCSEFYFGTNESMEFTYGELIQKIENAIDITCEEEKVLDRLFGRRAGQTFLHQITLDGLEDEDEE